MFIIKLKLWSERDNPSTNIVALDMILCGR